MNDQLTNNILNQLLVGTSISGWIHHRMDGVGMICPGCKNEIPKWFMMEMSPYCRGCYYYQMFLNAQGEIIRLNDLVTKAKGESISDDYAWSIASTRFGDD